MNSISNSSIYFNYDDTDLIKSINGLKPFLADISNRLNTLNSFIKDFSSYFIAFGIALLIIFIFKAFSRFFNSIF